MTNVSELYQGINSLLSLQPLVAVLNKMIAEDKPGARKLYQGLLDEVAAELLLAQGKPGSDKIFKEVAEEASEHRGADALGELFLIERMARVNVSLVNDDPGSLVLADLGRLAGVHAKILS